MIVLPEVSKETLLMRVEDLEARQGNRETYLMTLNLVCPHVVVKGDITAETGTLETLSITGTLTLSGSGKLITAASPSARIELTTTELAGYSDATTKEFYIDATDGQAYAGGGIVALNTTGVEIIVTDDYSDTRSYKFKNSGGTVLGRLDCYAQPASGQYLRLKCGDVAGSDSILLIVTDCPTGEQSQTQMQCLHNGSGLTYTQYTNGSTLYHQFSGADVYMAYGLAVGTTTDDPAQGEIYLKSPGGQLWRVRSENLNGNFEVRDDTGSADLLVIATTGLATMRTIELDVASGDPIIIFDTQGADKFTLGVDDSESDQFAICTGGSLAPGTAAITIGSGRNVAIPNGSLTISDGAFTVIRDGNPASVLLQSYRESAATHGELKSQAARGSEASPTKILSGDQLFRIHAHGYTGSAFDTQQPAEIRFKARSDWSVSQDAEIEFWTSSAERMVIDENGRVGIAVSSPGAQLDIDQASTTAAIPVLILDQGDVDQPFIEFKSGTVYTGKSGQDEYLMVKDPNGNTRYVRLFA